MPFSRNMDGIAFGARPLFCVNLPVGPVDFLLIDDYDMMRNTMCLIGRFRSVFNVSICHINSILEGTDERQVPAETNGLAALCWSRQAEF